MQIKHSKEQLKTKESELKKTASSFASDKKQLDKFEQEIASYTVCSCINMAFQFRTVIQSSVTLQKELQKLNYQDGLLEELQLEKRKLISEIRPLEDTVANIENRFVFLCESVGECNGSFQNFRRKYVCTRIISIFQEPQIELPVQGSGAQFPQRFSERVGL